MALNQIFQGIGAAPRGNQDSPLLDTLAAMNLQQLQDYATEHKNDAAMVALISSVANIKKRSRAAEQAQPVDPQQPKIGEQVIAGIAPQPAPQPAPQAQGLPEDSGIAQLPAQNIQGMAGGGIVAFEEGGAVPRFQNTGLVQGFKDIYNMTPQEIKEAAARKLRLASAVDTFKNASAVVPEAGAKSYLQGLKSLAGKAAGPLAIVGQNLFGTSDEELKTLREADARRAMQGMPQSTIKGFSDTTDLDKMIEIEAAKTAPAVVPPDGKLGGKPDAKLNTRPRTGADGNRAAPGSSLANAATKASDGIGALLPAKETAPDKKEILAEREAISKPIYEKAEGMINKEKARLSEGKEQDFYMALIEGGLAAAAGDSPNGIQNLAKGFSQGAKSYSSALKDFRKAAQENSKMELDIERAKAADKRGDLDAFEKANESAKNRAFERDKLETQGRFQLANTNLAGQFQLQASANSAAAQLKAAGMPGAQERLFAALGGGTDQASIVKGLKLFQEVQTDKPKLALFKAFMETPVGMSITKPEEIGPAFAKYVESYESAMGPLGGLPKGTTVTRTGP